MIAEINDRLEALCEALGREAFNYAVDLRLFPAVGRAGGILADLVSAALGRRVVVGDPRVSTASALIESLKAGLEYPGDDGAHPDRAFLAGAEFAVGERKVVSLVEDFVSTAERVTSFRLDDGHPFYPVFWDFAYVIERGADAYVFIGSSSD